MSEVNPPREAHDPGPPETAAADDGATAPRVGRRSGRLRIWVLACASVAATLLVIGIRTVGPEANPTPPPSTARVLVADHDMPPGTAITADNLDALFRWADLPSEAVPRGAVAEPTRLVGAETVRALRTGDPVAESDLAAPRFELPDGYRQVTVRVDASDAFTGGVTRATRVDVWLIPRGAEPRGPAERVLAGVFVIPTSMIDRLPEHPWEADRGVSITLALTPEQIDRVAAAEERGKLRIVPSN